MTHSPRRVPAGDELARLMRCHGYRVSRTGSVKGLSEAATAADLAAARADGWPVGATEQWTSRRIVDRVVELVAALDERAVRAAFVAGLGSAPRGRQTIISYGWGRFLGEAPGGADGVPDCGLDPLSHLDVTHELVRLALGWAWNERPAKYLPDLEAAVQEGLPAPTSDDRERLRALLDLIRRLPAGKTPGALEKEMARARIVPATDRYQRYGILIGLAEFGVLRGPAVPPSWDRFVPVTEVYAASRAQRGAPRSDITLPLAAWRGGIDEERASSLLAV
ncbi:hypothetical protein Q0Z83_057600 [Actinoplanes sichuanensis]|uniref:Regulator of nucleoside diphosphate kinase N-terminal domain-containing protein n=1 Tax=Actinoplanes sichuanensis TaxID=512349 RepID=A0ABW4A596_9ACTN|nr:hypothetical protein [Actinoplanes sichuanensis]BEL07569.1 hypothetical protein Q0Z83_057600 [Actinoplanes sichuanensis]